MVQRAAPMSEECNLERQVLVIATKPFETHPSGGATTSRIILLHTPSRVCPLVA